MKTRSDDGYVYFTASKPFNPKAGSVEYWEISYVGPSILDSIADFDRMAENEGPYHYLAGMVHPSGEVSIGQFFCRSLGWTIEGGKVRTCIFATLEADIKSAVRECEEAVTFDTSKMEKYREQ